MVHRQVFRTNSSILGRKLKNTKKAEQKKRRVERRVSEGDAEHMSGSGDSNGNRSGSWMNVRYGNHEDCDEDEDDERDERHNDSGVASSVEDGSQIPPKRRVQSAAVVKSVGKGKAKITTSQTKKKAAGGQFLKEANSDLIFDLDFWNSEWRNKQTKKQKESLYPKPGWK